jgi:hypothetical protein
MYVGQSAKRLIERCRIFGRYSDDGLSHFE